MSRPPPFPPYTKGWINPNDGGRGRREPRPGVRCLLLWLISLSQAGQRSNGGPGLVQRPRFFHISMMSVAPKFFPDLKTQHSGMFVLVISKDSSPGSHQDLDGENTHPYIHPAFPRDLSLQPHIRVCLRIGLDESMAWLLKILILTGQLQFAKCSSPVSWSCKPPTWEVGNVITVPSPPFAMEIAGLGRRVWGVYCVTQLPFISFCCPHISSPPIPDL